MSDSADRRDAATSFVRVLRRRDVLSLAFGAMIGWSWIILTGEWIQTAGSLGAIGAFCVGGAAIALIGLTYAELAAAMPYAGGEHVYSMRALGRAASFVCTWAIVLGYGSVVAFEAVALATVFDYLAPDLRAGYLWSVAGWDVHTSGVVVGVTGALVMTVLNFLGVRPAAVAQGIATSLILLGGAFLLLGASIGGEAGDLEPLFADGLRGVALVLAMVPFMFVGFDVIPQAAEEVNLPFRQLGSLLLLSVSMAVMWYAVIIASVAWSLAPEAISTARLATADAGAAVWGGSWASTCLVLAGTAGILTSWNAFLVAGSRAVYALARAGMLPEFLGRLHPRHRTPHHAVVLLGALSCLSPFFGRRALVWLVDAGGLGIVLAYGMVALSFLVLRRREPEMERPFRVPAGAWVGRLALLVSIALGLLYLPGSPAALLWPQEWMIVGGWIVLGAVLYAWARLMGGRR
jgi:APA family basic amino acid/polyamine antiporter